MSAETELLWPGVAFLLLLGVVASLCVRCFRSGKGGIMTGRGWSVMGRGWSQWRGRQYTQQLSQARPGCVWEGQSDKPHKMGVTPPRAGPKLHLNTISLVHWGALGLLGQGACLGQGFALDKGGKAGLAACLGRPPSLCSTLLNKS